MMILLSLKLLNHFHYYESTLKEQIPLTRNQAQEKHTINNIYNQH